MAESLSNVDDDLNNEVSLMLCRANKIKISTVRKEDLSPEVSSTCGPCPIARSYAVASTSGCLSCAPAMSYRTVTAHHKCKMMHQEASRRLLFEGINAAAAAAAPSPPGRLASIMCSGFLCGGIICFIYKHGSCGHLQERREKMIERKCPPTPRAAVAFVVAAAAIALPLPLGCIQR
ncbi:unnamed protein product [Musa acuminata subsp. malaccensis]|uniref:(wild Malaysian banana) hypothetical protein n=1 Tax=Musa acuminata subsp. malaccensis TaxID=214687 RepID=A0A804KGN7_MUSAM|nr:unnamed protein product [Musa acuminata subsp. malaccensis]